MPEHHARRFFLLMEQIELLGELAMIALLGFFDLLQIRLEFVIGCKRHAVDALQLRIVGVAAQVHAADANQLECATKLAGRWQIRERKTKEARVGKEGVSKSRSR